MTDRTHCPRSEFSQTFWTRMKMAMSVSFHKYGVMRHAFPHKVNALKTLKLKLAEYEDQETGGNKDLLVDIANYAMIEFMAPRHENAHDKPKDGSSGRYWGDSGRATERANDGARKI